MMVELDTERLAERLGDDWEVVRVGWPKQGETYLSDCGTEVVKSLRADVGIRLIVRRKWEWPAWIKPGTWLAMDADGCWHIYQSKPEAGEWLWRWTGGFCSSIKDQLFEWTPPETSDDWRQTLMQKPTETK